MQCCIYFKADSLNQIVIRILLSNFILSRTRYFRIRRQRRRFLCWNLIASQCEGEAISPNDVTAGTGEWRHVTGGRKHRQIV